MRKWECSGELSGKLNRNSMLAQRGVAGVLGQRASVALASSRTKENKESSNLTDKMKKKIWGLKGGS